MKNIVYLHFNEIRDYLIQQGKISKEDAVENLSITESGKSVKIELTGLSQEHKDFLATNIYDMDITAGLLLVFERIKIRYGEDILKIRRETEWRKIPNVGTKKIQEINQILREYKMPPLEK